MSKKFWKQMLAGMLMLCLAITAIPLRTQAAEKTYLALGDSITTGFRLENVNDCFANLLSGKLGLPLVNKAKNGGTSASLLAEISEETYITEIKKAAVITITVGGNDIMDVFYEFLAEEYNTEYPGSSVTGEEMRDMLASGDSEVLDFAGSHIEGFNQSQQAITAMGVFADNFASVIQKLKSLNSEAVIVIGNQYNPYEYLANKYGSLYANAEVISDTFDEGCRNLNAAMEAGADGSLVADVYTTFRNAVADSIDPCNASASIGSGFSITIDPDFHPNKTGHALIADCMWELLDGVVVPGEGEDPIEGEVVRIGGKDRYQTAFKTADALKEQLGVDKFNTVIVACGTNFADALSGSYLASKTNAPILLANEKSTAALAEYLNDNLTQNGIIYILGGENAVSANVENAVSNYGNVRRLAGKTRLETNLKILEEAGVTGEDILVAASNNFADSLSASATSRPILLVSSELKEDQKMFLEKHIGNTYYILGGDAAVSEEIKTQVATYGITYRVSGSNRYETSIAIAEAFFETPQMAVLASGTGFPDGLSGGPLAISKNAALILTSNNSNQAAGNYMRNNAITNGVVLGGTGVISDATVNALFGR